MAKPKIEPKPKTLDDRIRDAVTDMSKRPT
jgi:hypothetical protein